MINNCENCINKNICKFVENTNSIRSQVKELEIQKNSPIRVGIECSMFKSNQQGYSYKISDLNQQLNNSIKQNCINGLGR